MSQPTIVCLIPIKNEAWILDRCLKCASLWADNIIIADQQSTDGSREIALSYPKVILIDNPSPTYNELERQKLLIAEARKIPGQKLLIAIDADEVLVGYDQTREWETIKQARPGTSFWFQWANILPGLEKYYTPDFQMLFGYMDDGKEHRGNLIHSPRVPISGEEPRILCSHIKVLHYQYTDWNRMKSKHRWYQCLERINFPHRSSIEIYRQYHHMDIPPSETKTIPANWLETYESEGIDMTSINTKTIYWWDREILNLLDKYGNRAFSREAIWDIQWDKMHEQCFHTKPKIPLSDPRNLLEKLVHKWLSRTQLKSLNLKDRIINILLRFVGW